MANNIISTGFNAGDTIYNSNGGTLISGDAVKGGYFVTDIIENAPDWTHVDGTLCYCTSTASFYQYSTDTNQWLIKITNTQLTNLINLLDSIDFSGSNS